MLKTLLAEVFAEDLVAVVGEELLPNVFTSLPFNHIVFTGSPAVGKIVMRTAAAEPDAGHAGTRRQVARSGDAQLPLSRRRQAHHARQVHQCGQICVSPDYALVPRERVDDFIAGVRPDLPALLRQTSGGNPDYTSVVDERQFQRITGCWTMPAPRARTSNPAARRRWATSRTLPLQILTDLTPTCW